MTERRIVVVDVETSALYPSRKVPGVQYRDGQPPARGAYGVVVEVGWWDLSTDECGSFVPRHDVAAVRQHGSPEALEVCRYLSRLSEAQQDDGTEVRALHQRLKGATLAGANPAFDATFLRDLFAGLTPPDPWHHRLLDLEAYHAGATGRHGGDMLGLAKIADELSISAPNHTAFEDAKVTAAALIALGAVDMPADPKDRGPAYLRGYQDGRMAQLAEASS